jgi:DNA-directed RNA polymerase subunit RPC12/RpoP
MADDMDDDFLEYDVGMGGGAVECPSCGAKVPYSVLLDEEGVCPKCGKKIDIDDNSGDDEEDDDDSEDDFDDDGDDDEEEDDDDDDDDDGDV